jgi:predicted MPP superfamily phosphohydrolase
MLEPLLLPLAALGHFCLSVLVVNVVHGLGFSEGTMKAVKIAAISWLVGMGGALVGLAIVSGRPGWAVPVEVYGLVCVAVAGVGLPVVTVRRWLRRQPEGVSGTSRVVDLAEGKQAGRLVGKGLDSFWLRLPGNQVFQMELTDWQVTLPGLPASLDGLVVLQLTDLHLAPAYDPSFFREALDLVAGVEADLVVFTGDLIDDEGMLPLVEPLLSGFRGRLGQYAILGNHDERFDPAGPKGALEAAGFEVLDGGWKRIEDGGGSIALGGTCHPWGAWVDEPPAADTRILLCHAPDPIYRAAGLGVDLMLSGHTHGGQYRLPGIGPVLMPSIYSRRFDQGFFRVGPTLMYVGRGIAAQHPLRVNARPEISRFVLRAPERVGGAPSWHIGRGRVVDRA